jgi:2,5-diamino-6-(ribosylamino)-4(3H)-pyrimidinone 5'-phosphate reductase
MNRPYVIINVAMTADGKTDTFERGGARISSSEDWERVDHLRTESDAVMVGGKTLVDEDPRLTIKNPDRKAKRISRGLDENPIKVGVISEAKIPMDSRFINDGPAFVMIFTSKRTPTEEIKALRDQGVQVYVIGETRVDLTGMLDILSGIGISRLLVEGGGTLNSALIQAKLVDEIQIYLAPMIFGGSEAPTLADGFGLTREKAIHLITKSIEPLDDGGVIIQYRVKNDW